MNTLPWRRDESGCEKKAREGEVKGQTDALSEEKTLIMPSPSLGRLSKKELTWVSPSPTTIFGNDVFVVT